MSTESAARKDIQKLQRAIIGGLEDVKAQDIQVFDTELLSPLFERVIVASGSSNRQTKALAASVRDAVRDAGYNKPRTEGEENGEWIIVDCGVAVVHIMQPAYRQYYRLEDLWGDKPVRLKFGAPKPPQPELAAVKKATAKKVPAKKAATKSPVAKKTAAAKVPRSAAAKSAAKSPAAKKTAPRKTAAASGPARKRSVRSAPKTS